MPAVVKLGVPGMAAHLFVFYYGAISDMTPPLVISAAVAAGIAGADPFRASLTACRLGLVAYLIPFMFVYDVAFLFHGTWAQIAVATLAGAVGAIALAAGVQGFLLRRTSLAERGLLLAAAATLAAPGLVWRAVGVALVVAVGLVQARAAAAPVRANFPLR